jgi:hypothetical protein
MDDFHEKNVYVKFYIKLRKLFSDLGMKPGVQQKPMSKDIECSG